jgi:hypothetical protein
MASEWYIARNGETYGPFTFDELTARICEEGLRREDLVWCAGMADWQPAGDVVGLWLPPPVRAPATPTTPPGGQDPSQRRDFEVAPQEKNFLDERENNVALLETQKEPSREPGIIMRHWRGEFSLPLAYWGIGVFLTLLVVAFSHVFGEWLAQANLPPIGVGVALMSFLSFLCMMTIWQLVGVWRAAGNHTKSTGRSVWGNLARLAVLLGALRAIADFSTVIWPMLSESAILASGRDDTPAHQLRLLRNGTEVELAGGMPFGTADALGKLLDAAPGVRVVHLNSIGGRVGEGYLIYELIRDRKLASYTATDCVSACTIAFLGGSERYLSSKARLGFHSMSFAGFDHKQVPEINAELRRMLAKHGAPPWFVDKALSTAASSMWYPSHKELTAAKIVTRIVDPDQFAISGIVNWRDTDALERGLISIPFYAVVRDNDPDAFKKIVSRVSDAIKLGKSGPELTQDVHAVFVAEILPKYLQVAPDGVIQRYWRSQLAEMDHLRKSDPALCMAFVFPELRREGFNVNKLVPAELLAEDIASLTELIERAIRTPSRQKPANLDEEFAAVTTRISKRMPAAQEILSEPTKYFHDPKTLCGALLAFYTEILNLPVSRSGAMLRSIATP